MSDLIILYQNWALLYPGFLIRISPRIGEWNNFGVDLDQIRVGLRCPGIAKFEGKSNQLDKVWASLFMSKTSPGLMTNLSM